MQVHPTRTTVDLALAGMFCILAGVILRQAAVVSWGGAILIGLALARAVTRVSVAKIRARGFEMLWREDPRFRRLTRGESVELCAEVRNRDDRAARFVGLRAVCSPHLLVRIEPQSGEVPAAGRLRVQVKIAAPRVGRHGIHGLSLEVSGGPGLFEVPLTFANPFGIEVLPRTAATALRSARGGRSRMMAQAGRPGPLSGDGAALRELREHQPGDPFKRIAWKASARRGKLLVRDFEREERDVVWLLLDASVELWAGEPGHAPLDLAIDQVASVAQRHLAQGDLVGLGVVATRFLAWMRPSRGPGWEVELANVLAHATATIDADRSALDETEVASRVLDHMRPLDPAGTARLKASDLDRIARRAERLCARAPMVGSDAWAAAPRERILRRYLDAYGMGSPPRSETDREATDLQLVRALDRLLSERPRASLAYVWSPLPPPHTRPAIQRALRAHPRRRVAVRWVRIDALAGIPEPETSYAAAVAYAVCERAHVAEAQGAQALRALGVPVERISKRSPLSPRSGPAPDDNPNGSTHAPNRSQR